MRRKNAKSHKGIAFNFCSLLQKLLQKLRTAIETEKSYPIVVNEVLPGLIGLLCPESRGSKIGTRPTP